MIFSSQEPFSIRPVLAHLKGLQSFKSNYILLLILAGLSSASNLAFPALFARTITAFHAKLLGQMTWALAMLFCLQESQTLLDLAATQVRSRFSTVANQDIVEGFYHKIQSLPMVTFKKFQHTGEIYQRVIDTLQLNNLVTEVALQLTLGLLRLGILLGVLAWMDLRVALITLAFLSTYYILHLWATPRLRQLQDATFMADAPLTTALFEGLNKIRTIKAMGAKDHVMATVRGRLRNSLESRLRLISYSSKVSFINGTVTNLARVVIVLVIAYRTFQGALTLPLGLSLVVVSLQIFEPMQTFINLFVDLTRSLSILARYRAILEEPSEIMEGDGLARLGAEEPFPVSFENVHFAYDDRQVLNGFSMNVPKGFRVALVGRSGSGKTTLLNLLLGLYIPASGTIRVDGIDLADLDLTQFRKQVGVVLQEDFLFPGTLRQNVTFGLDRPCSDAEIIRALDSACLWVRFASESTPLELPLKEGILSGGEVQRLVLARAFLRNPALLIFDEPTSALDLETESQIQASMDTLLKGRTSITIAHRLSTIMKSDLIYVLDNGKIVERGTHVELITKEGHYYRLYRNSLVA